MSTIIIARLLRAQCNRILGMSTLDADFEQPGDERLCHRPIKLLLSYGSQEDDWQRCLLQYQGLEPRRLYCLRGATLAAGDGTVLLMGQVHIEPVRDSHHLYLAAA